MKITKVTFEGHEGKSKALATCSVTLDDSLKLTNIRLFCNDEKGYYLVLPSKQDVYNSVVSVNKGTEIKLPKNLREEVTSGKKQFEEFFFPVRPEFYRQLLDTVIDAYIDFKEKGCWSYRPV